MALLKVVKSKKVDETISIDTILEVMPGFTIAYSNVFKIGNWYDIHLTIKKKSGFFLSSDEELAKMKDGYYLNKQYYYGCFDSYGLWNVESVGYVACGNNIIHKSIAENKYVYTRIHLTGVLTR